MSKWKKLNDVSPRLSVSDFPDVLISDSVSLSKNRVALFRFFNLAHDFLCKFGMSMCRAARNSAAISRVRRVLGKCPISKMIRIYAGRIIAGMQHKAFRPFSTRQIKGVSMRVSVVWPFNGKPAVSVAVFSCRPNPTLAAFIDLTPKPFFNVGHWAAPHVLGVALLIAKVSFTREAFWLVYFRPAMIAVGKNIRRFCSAFTAAIHRLFYERRKSNKSRTTMLTLFFHWFSYTGGNKQLQGNSQ